MRSHIFVSDEKKRMGGKERGVKGGKIEAVVHTIKTRRTQTIYHRHTAADVAIDQPSATGISTNKNTVGVVFTRTRQSMVRLGLTAQTCSASLT